MQIPGGRGAWAGWSRQKLTVALMSVQEKPAPRKENDDILVTCGVSAKNGKPTGPIKVVQAGYDADLSDIKKRLRKEIVNSVIKAGSYWIKGDSKKPSLVSLDTENDFIKAKSSSS